MLGYPRLKRTRKRSSWASGSGKVPSWSMGFCVAMTQKRRLQLVRHAVDGDAALGHRLQQARLGPRRGPVDLVGQHDLGEDRAGTELELGGLRLKTETPVTSVGSRSGVHWMRLNEQPTLRASARASMVLATPGTSSSNTCPPQNQETNDSTICRRLPTMTFSTLAMIFLAVAATSFINPW